MFCGCGGTIPTCLCGVKYQQRKQTRKNPRYQLVPGVRFAACGLLTGPVV